ncbi:MAG: pyruvate kinase [Thermoprotei archaeon]
MQRFTKIVCTIGPATSSREALGSLIKAGMDVARLNFSHGTHEEHASRIRMIREVSKELGTPVAIILDLPGPKLRVGKLVDEPLKLEAGEKVTLSVSKQGGEVGVIPVHPEGFAQMVDVGSEVFLADGMIRMRVVEKNGPNVVCEVEVGGNLTTGKGVNVPHVKGGVGAITEEDKGHIEFGVKNDVDYIAVSFVRSAADIDNARRLVTEFGSDVPLIAKIEKSEAVDNLEEIIKRSDAVMVARGDLGVELGLENVPLIQKRIISLSNAAGRPVITATQILLSMLTYTTPTRAEVSDIANAILDGTDALMLSEETAVGPNYLEAVRVLDRVCRKVESELRYGSQEVLESESVEDAVGMAACRVASAIRAEKIVAYTRSGSTARLIAKYRPHTEIVAFSPNENVVRRLKLVWGVQPFKIDEVVGELNPEIVENALRAFGLAKSGERAVVVAGAPTGPVGTTNMIRVQQIH